MNGFDRVSDTATTGVARRIGCVDILDRLLTTRQLADYLDVPVAALYAWRYAGIGPPRIPGRQTHPLPARRRRGLDPRSTRRSRATPLSTSIPTPTHPRFWQSDPTGAGNLLEIIWLELADDDNLVIYAMALRPAFYDLLPQTTEDMP